MTDKQLAATPVREDDEPAMSEEEIDRNLMGTFPASDPPSWTLGTDHPDGSSRLNADTDDNEE